MVDTADVDSTISFKLEKNTLNVQSDPMHHGFWYLSLTKGALPVGFRGKYTKRSQALAAARDYMALKTKE